MIIRLISAAILLLLTFGCSRPATIASVVTVELPIAGGITVGSAVRFHGIDVGHVQRITPLRDGARLELVIDRPDTPIRAADRVAVRPDGVFGAKYVDVVQGPDTAPPLALRATLRAAPPDSLAPIRDALLRVVGEEIVERLHNDSARPAPRPTPRQ